MVEVPQQRFEELVVEALDGLPEDLGRAMRNVAIFVEDEHPDDPHLLGLYEGVPLTERGEWYGGVLPDRITIYRLPICRGADSDAEVVDEVRVTVIHEIAHHFGISDERLHELGWA